MGDAQQMKTIRNISFSGHGGSGKTTLVEAILFHCKATTRLGRVEDGTTLSDYLAEEKTRKSSLNTAILHCNLQGMDCHLIDTPGYPDFLGEAISGIFASDIVVIAVAANEGISAVTRKVFRIARDLGKAVAFVFTKMDAENIEYDPLLQSVQETFGAACLPVAVPVDPGPGISRVVDLLDAGSIQGAVGEIDAASLREKVLETAIETDDALLEKYLEGEEIAPEALSGAIRNAMVQGKLVPIFATSVPKDVGIREFLSAVQNVFPSPTEVPPPVLQGEGAVTPSLEGGLAAQVFKSITDDYVGKLSFFRVFSGRLTPDGSVKNARTGKPERFQNLFRMQGKEQQPVEEAVAGGVYAVSKIETLEVSDTLCGMKDSIQFEPIRFPQPMVSLAVQPKSRQDEQRISGALGKLSEEDPTFQVARDRQTKELLITGLSQLHLDLKLKQLKRRFSVEVNTKPPNVPYRETITAKGDARYRHKKQTGGAGQFAEVWMRIEPLLDEEGRHEGFEYVSEVVGGAISQSFIPSIEKGVKQVLLTGPVAGCPVEGVKVVVYDGKEHPVDSKDIAFQIAGREVFKLAMGQSKPKLLEPIMNMEVSVPSRFMGDLTADLNSRRGRIQGMNAEGDLQIITAQVPLAEMLSYSTELKSMTQDEGSFEMTLSHYEIVPDNVAQMVIQKRRKEMEEDRS
ncbi:MAG: elongation factor G [Planctomycetota bacterium]|jgi:elongation factor G